MGEDRQLYRVCRECGGTRFVVGERKSQIAGIPYRRCRCSLGPTPGFEPIGVTPSEANRLIVAGAAPVWVEAGAGI